ncbi:uncharacterized protein LOC118458492 isoform X2 [Anopheles albimanus]|nr:uncharacterized protein LOC118458492 isoform X2 [Anopheles albimanus]
MERSESGDDQANEEDCGVMAPDATAQDTCTADDAKMQEECAGVDAVGIGSVQPQKPSENEDVIVCISDSDSEDSILEVASHEQVYFNSDEVENEENKENGLAPENASTIAQPGPTEQNRIVLPLPPLYHVRPSADNPMSNNTTINLPLPPLMLIRRPSEVTPRTVVHSEVSLDTPEEFPIRDLVVRLESLVELPVHDSDVSTDSTEELPVHDSDVSLDLPEKPPLQDSDSSQANPVEPDSWEIFEISDDEEVSKPATLDGHSFDLTGDCSDEDAKTTIVNKSAGDLLSSAPSKQVAAPNEDMESINELPTEAYSADAAKSQLPYQTIEPGVDYRNASQPVRDVHVPSGDGAAKVVAEQQRHSTRLPSHHVAPFIQEAGGGGSSTSSSSTAVSLYHSRPVGNASGNGRIQCRQSGLPNIRLNETHFLDKLLAAVYPKFHTEPVYTKTRGGFEYTRLLKLYSRKKCKSDRAGGSSNPRDVILRSPFYEGPTRYGGASALRSNRDSRLLQVAHPVRQDALSRNRNQYHLVTPLLSSASYSQQTYAPDETHSPPRQPINQSFKSTRSWNPPYTVPKRPRVPMEELVIPTITQLLKYKRQLQTKDNLHGSEEDRDADTESDDTTSDFEQGGIIHSPSPAYIASTAGKSDKKQTTKIKPTITRTRPSAASSSNDLFAPALRHELPNVALQGLTSLPKLDVSPEFCFGPGSSQPAWKMMTSVSNSVDKQHQPLSVAAEPSSVPFQFIHPEILGSWLENTNLSSSGPSIVFDFAAPISLETDVVSGSAVPIQSDSARPAKLVPFAQLPKTGARKWECPTCMLFNELSITRCIACECPQPTTKETAGTTSMKPNQSSTTDSTADFKSIVSTRVDGDWECQDCFVRNAANRARCICCGGTPKVFPSSTAGSLAATEQNKPAANIIPAASGDFQLLTQQQKIGKWECSMCLTRNNEVTLRCVCCEQPKPPSTAKQPLVTSNETPATLSSDGVWRMLETTTPVNEKNPIVNKFAFIAPTNATFGNADKFAVDNLTTNQQNFGDIGTIQTFETVSHSSATPLAVA